MLKRILMSLALAAPSALAGDLELRSGSALWLEGDSTLHAYRSEATRLELEFSWKGAATLGSPASLSLRVPVAGLKSEHKGLDKNLRKALAADEHPDIVFALSSYAVEASSDGRRTIVADGALSVAGVTKTRELRATLEEKDGALVLEGEHALLMTDFGVKPPTALLGTVRAKNRVVVRFRLDLGRKP